MPVGNQGFWVFKWGLIFNLCVRKANECLFAQETSPNNMLKERFPLLPRKVGLPLSERSPKLMSFFCFD